tara:strand:- start:1125 stop:1673 length:549 start_codon:yes stop_codon:yes gene_type:complete
VNSLYDFIIKPLNQRYDNETKIGDKSFILNTTIENHKFVSKKAVVVSTPTAYSSPVKVGDEVYVHHNIFRRWYDQKGRERNSARYFKDNLYFCGPDQLYMYDNKSHLDYCFVRPVDNSSYLHNRKEQPNEGIVHTCPKNQYVKVGDHIIFKPDCEFEFLINKEKLYCMKLNKIVLNYENQRN